MKLRDVVTLVRGNTYKSSLISENNGPVLLGLGSIERDGGFRHGSLKRYPGPSDQRILLHPGDLYVSLKDLTQSCNLLGAVARVPEEVTEGRLTQDTVKLEFINGATDRDKAYVYWSLRSPQYRNYCKSMGTGTTNVSLSRDDFLNWGLPEESQANNLIIDLLELIEDQISVNSRINGYLGELIDALFRRKFLQSIDDSWTKATLLDIANYKNGLAMQKFRPEGDDTGLPVLKIKELGQGRCAADAERCKSDIDESVHVHDGDLIFSWSGTLLLDFWAGGDAGLNQHLFKVTSDKYDPWFYYLWTNYHMRKFTALAKDRATTMGHIKRSALAEAEVFLPDTGCMRELGAIFEPLINQMISTKLESQKLEELRDILLPKLMSGEINTSGTAML